MAHRVVAMAGIAAAFSVSVIAHAQDSYATMEQVEQAEAGKSLKSAPSAGPLIDRGNSAAKDLAQREGISVGEATRQLRLSQQASNAQSRRGARGFGVRASLERGRMKFYVSPDQTVDEAAIRNEFDPDLRGSVDFQAMPKPIGELTGTISRLSKVLGQAEAVTGFQMSPAKGTVDILSTDVERTKEAISRLGIATPSFLGIVASQPIVLTDSAYGGTTAGLSTTSCRDAMWGFIAYDGGDILKPGILTVAHVTRNNSVTQLRNGQSSAASACGGGSTWQPRIRDWRGGAFEDRLGIDIAFHRLASGTTYYPYFWNGAAYVKVLSAIFPAAETPVCKYGHVTGKTCGRVEEQLRWSNGYGYMSAVRITDGSPLGSAVGDSGGPVWFSTNTAVGIEHAQWSLNGVPYFLYSEIEALADHSANVTIATSN